MERNVVGRITGSATMPECFLCRSLKPGRITKKSLPRAPIVWLTRAVKVERPLPRVSTLTALASPRGRRLGGTLGVCMLGLRPG